MENEGHCASHKLHLDPDEVRSSRYHQMRKVDGDESDGSDEWDLDESDEDEWEGGSDDDNGNKEMREFKLLQKTSGA